MILAQEGNLYWTPDTTSGSGQFESGREVGGGLVSVDLEVGGVGRGRVYRGMGEGGIVLLL